MPVRLVTAKILGRSTREKAWISLNFPISTTYKVVPPPDVGWVIIPISIIISAINHGEIGVINQLS